MTRNVKILLLMWPLALPIFLLADFTTDDSNRIGGYYNYWRGKYLKESVRVEGGMYVDYQGKGTTCSEAQGYGMLLTVLLSRRDDHQAKRDFEALNQYQKTFRSNIDARLMAWRVDDRSRDSVNTTCATDGDMDIAFALLTAAKKWDNADYFEQAKNIISGIEESLIRDDFSLRRGDWDTTQHSVRLSDIMPTHFRAFSEVSDRELWRRVTDTHYDILNATVGVRGVFPDFVVKTGGKWKAAPPKYLESEYDGMFYYNSCRVPWRLSCAMFEFGDERAAKLLILFDRGIGKVGNREFMAGYKRDGLPINSWTDGAFTAPHMCSLLVAKRTEEFNRAIDYQLQQKESYFQDTIRLLSIYLCLENSP